MGIGLCRVKDAGDLVPAYTASTPFRLEVFPPDGILQNLSFYIRGTHVTLITAGGTTDGEVRTINDLRVTAPRRGRLKPIIHNALPRDLKHITSLFEGQLPDRANPLGDGLAHFGEFSIYYAPPPHLVANPASYGLDTSELSGPIIVEGTYDAVTSIGPSATAITQQVTVTACSIKRTGVRPTLALTMNRNAILHESDSRLGPTNLGVGNMDLLWMLYLRQNDVSAVSASRVDGLITRFDIEHSEEGDLNDELFQQLKKRTGKRFKLANADIPAGIAISEFSPGGLASFMPSMLEGQELQLRHDSTEAVPAEVTDVTPAAGDSIEAIPIGVQFTQAGEGRRAERVGGGARINRRAR